MTQDLVHLHFHCYDCAFDYNPEGLEGRGVVCVGHFRLTRRSTPSRRSRRWTWK